MLSRLEYDENQPERPRGELDRTLEVASWRVPGTRFRAATRVDPAEPYWWRGDEDASQSFLRAVGVVT